MYIIRCICLWMILGLMACSGPVRIHSRMWPGEIRDQDRERRLFRDPGLRLEKAVAYRFRESSECNRTSLRE